MHHHPKNQERAVNLSILTTLISHKVLKESIKLTTPSGKSPACDVVRLCFVVCVCLCVCDDRRRDARMCLISWLGMISISCKHFSLQRAPHAGVFEAAALFFDA